MSDGKLPSGPKKHGYIYMSPGPHSNVPMFVPGMGDSVDTDWATAPFPGFSILNDFPEDDSTEQ